jgi:hypothetical protein
MLPYLAGLKGEVKSSFVDVIEKGQKKRNFF